MCPIKPKCDWIYIFNSDNSYICREYYVIHYIQLKFYVNHVTITGKNHHNQEFNICQSF